jgi:hypothetical protein
MNPSPGVTGGDDSTTVSTQDVSRILQMPRFIVDSQSLIQAPVELISLAGGENGSAPLGFAAASPTAGSPATSTKHSRHGDKCDGKPCETD